jgi:hypothetical protein
VQLENFIHRRDAKSAEEFIFSFAAERAANENFSITLWFNWFYIRNSINAR